VSSLDVTATALAVAGIDPDESLDGVDLIPLLRSDAAGERALFWRVGGQSAVRRGEWKLVSRPGKPAEFYNLDADPGETTDLRDKQPEQFIDLREQLKNWSAGMDRPRWSPRPSSRKK
jgi:arylsulfatase A-like enzyme